LAILSILCEVRQNCMVEIFPVTSKKLETYSVYKRIYVINI
jgi:hypothetical protein